MTDGNTHASRINEQLRELGYEPDGPACPDCGDRELRTSDAVYATCESCGSEIERTEVGL